MGLSLALSLISALTNAISRILTKTVLKYANTRDYLSVNFAALFILLCPFTPFFFRLEFSLPAIGALLLAATLDGAANYFYFRTFEIDDVNTASALLSLSPLFTLIISPLMWRFNESPLRMGHILGICVTVLGIAVLNRTLYERHQMTKASQRTPLHLLLPIIASGLFGINAYTIKFIFLQDYMNPFTYYVLRLFLIALMTHILLKPDLRWVNVKSLSAIAGRGVFVILQWMTMLYALVRGSPPMVKAVSESSPLFVMLLSTTFLHEKISLSKLVGVCIIVGGLILITV